MRHELKLPHAEEAEMAVLGALIANVDECSHVLDELSEEDFYLPRHRLLWGAILDIHRRGGLVEPVSVREELEGRGKLRDVGGLPYISELLDAHVTTQTVPYHIKIIADRALLRRLYKAGRETIDAALAHDRQAAEVVDDAERRILAVSRDATAGGYVRLSQKFWDVMAMMENGGVKGVPSGLQGVDRMLGGFKNGNLIIVAGSTSMGKSAFALQCATNAAVQSNVPVGIFSIEMTTEENTQRILANEAMADLAQMIKGEPSQDDMVSIEKASSYVYKAPIFLEDGALRVSEIRAIARRMKRDDNVGLIVVDHIHDMVADGENRREQLGSIGRGLKHLAKELDIPVVAVSQLSRAPAQRADHRPQLSDLRETGDLEAIANVVILLYRPEYYYGPKSPGGEDLVGKAEAIIAKNRNGPTGYVPLRFTGYCARFDDCSGN